MADSMLQNLLKTPRQIREEQLQKMRNEAAGRAQLGGPIRGAQSALPGIFSSVLQQQRPALATDIAQTARGLTQGLGGMLGAAGYQQAGQALAQATVTPEERQAAQAQSVLKGLDMTQPDQLAEAAKRLQSLGLSGAASSLLQRAQKLQSGQIDVALTAAKIQTEAAKQADLLAKAGKSKEEIATEIALRNPRINEILAKQLASEAQARQRTAEAVQIETLTPIKAALENKRIEAENAGIDLTNKKMSLISAQISTEEIQQRAKEQNITESEAKTQLLEAEIDRYIALTPGEIIKQAADIEETKAKRNLAIARIAELSQTDFLRELDRSGLNEQEQQKIIQDRVKSLSSPEGLTGAQSQVVGAKIKVVTDAMETAKGASTSLEKIERAIPLLNDANVGAFGAPLAYVNKIMGDVFGLDSAQASTVANELLQVLGNEITLDQAENLKGALSERDLDFLVKASPTVAKSSKSLAILFQDLYKERFAEQFVALELERQISNLSDAELKDWQAGEALKELTELGEFRATQVLARKLRGK